MAQYRSGTFTSPSVVAAQRLVLGFKPTSFKLTNATGYGTNTVVAESKYYQGMAAGTALINTVTTGSLAPSILGSNGFTPFSAGAIWPTTQSTITAVTKANPGVVTVSSVGDLSEGATVTISDVKGMTQLNTNRYIVTNLSTAGPITFQLYDLFGNPVDTSAFGTYVSGGQVNVISDTEVPPGNQFDEGDAGIILGTGLFRANADVFFWEAWLETPTGW